MAIRVRATVGGYLAITPNTWACSLEFGASAPLDVTQMQAAAQGVADAAGSSSGFVSSLGSTTRVTFVRLEMHDPDVGPATAVGEVASLAIPGTAAGVASPPQCCVVASLRTGLPGRSFRGRVYWPASGIQPQGSLGSGVQAAVNTDVQNLAQLVAAQVGAQGSNLAWGVWSKVKGVMTPITNVQVGARCDTQRGRNGGLDTYTNFPVT